MQTWNFHVDGMLLFASKLRYYPLSEVIVLIQPDQSSRGRVSFVGLRLRFKSLDYERLSRINWSLPGCLGLLLLKSQKKKQLEASQYLQKWEKNIISNSCYLLNQFLCTVNPITVSPLISKTVVTVFPEQRWLKIGHCLARWGGWHQWWWWWHGGGWWW